MRRPTLLSTIALAITLAACGCGSDAAHTTASQPQSTTTDAASRQATPVVLEVAVRQAVKEDHALLTRALLTNRVPADPKGTAGPALAALRRSAVQRRAQKVRVRILSETFRVLAVQLDPSYTAATARVLNIQRIQANYDGRPSAPSTSREHVRLELHRIGETDRFVVWKVALLR
jgi:hypothetical protein